MLKDAGAVLEFVTAGNATFTLRSVQTGARFTYKMRKCEDNPNLFFVALMNGPDNENNFNYLGVVRNRQYAHGRKSRIGHDAASNIAFDWFWKHVSRGHLPTTVECWHEGKCGRCGRKLTVPESIERGIGPECAQHVGRLSNFQLSLDVATTTKPKYAVRRHTGAEGILPFYEVYQIGHEDEDGVALWEYRNEGERAMAKEQADTYRNEKNAA
jgi:hypothetical protein